MTEFGVRLPDLGDVVLAFALTFHFLAVCAAVSIPWLAAHLEFWGMKEEFQSDRAAAQKLSDIAVYNLGAVFMSGMLCYLLASIRMPEKLFTASVLLAQVLGALFDFPRVLRRVDFSLPAGLEVAAEDRAPSCIHRSGRRSHGGILRGFSRGASRRDSQRIPLAAPERRSVAHIPRNRFLVRVAVRVSHRVHDGRRYHHADRAGGVPVGEWFITCRGCEAHPIGGCFLSLLDFFDGRPVGNFGFFPGAWTSSAGHFRGAARVDSAGRDCLRRYGCAGRNIDERSQMAGERAAREPSGGGVTFPDCVRNDVDLLVETGSSQKRRRAGVCFNAGRAPAEPGATLNPGPFRI